MPGINRRGAGAVLAASLCASVLAAGPMIKIGLVGVEGSSTGLLGDVEVCAAHRGGHGA